MVRPLNSTSSWETARFLDVGGERVYTIVFGCERPVAKVLLCGPFPADRLYSLAAWVKWARFLARNNVLAIRFDYRGTGESTGSFTETSFHHWLEDVQEMAAWAAAQYGQAPLVLHGKEMGALLAQKVFASGSGDGLLMWSPPPSARELLRQGLTMRLSMDLMLLKPGERKSAETYLSDLSAGRPVEVDGYIWSAGLWQSSADLALEQKFARPGEGNDQERPWNHLLLGYELVPLVKSPRLLRVMNPRSALVPDSQLNPDFSSFFQMNLNWLLDRVVKVVGCSNA
jgi:hypothetical protein